LRCCPECGATEFYELAVALSVTRCEISGTTSDMSQLEMLENPPSVGVITVMCGACEAVFESLDELVAPGASTLSGEPGSSLDASLIVSPQLLNLARNLPGDGEYSLREMLAPGEERR